MERHEKPPEVIDAILRSSRSSSTKSFQRMLRNIMQLTITRRRLGPGLLQVVRQAITLVLDWLIPPTAKSVRKSVMMHQVLMLLAVMRGLIALKQDPESPVSRKVIASLPSDERDAFRAGGTKDSRELAAAKLVKRQIAGINRGKNGKSFFYNWWTHSRDGRY